MPGRRLLVVVYPYPPTPSTGGNRWSAAAKYLRRLGHDVTVLTTSAFGRLPDDAANGVVRTRDLITARPLRALLRRPPLAAVGEELPSLEKPAPGLLTSIVVPDAFAMSWSPAAYLAARRIVRERGIDCIVTSSPFESTHLIALALGPSRPAWVADFRDGWTFEPLRAAFPTAAQRALDRRLERAVAEHADALVAVTPPIADDLARRFGVEAASVPNGWDPDLEPAANSSPLSVAATPGRFGLLHTGGFTGRDPGPLFDALVLLSREEPDLAARLELVLAGRLTPPERRLIERTELDGIVRHVGMLPRAQALALQRRADALLLLTSRQSSEATGKLFEYLAAGRPILALAQENAAARIVEETATGLTVPPDDVPAIVRALKTTLDGGLEAGWRPHGLERYRYPEIAEALADQVERAISGAARAAGRQPCGGR
jgi:glycosyltransferase involved in cell wall biosynthesis